MKTRREHSLARFLRPLLVAACALLIALPGCQFAPSITDDPRWGAATRESPEAVVTSEVPESPKVPQASESPESPTSPQSPASPTSPRSPASPRAPADPDVEPGSVAEAARAAEETVSEGKSYTSPEEVAAYLHLFGRLPPNFISKTKARKKGWDSQKGNLQKVCPGMSIGGSTFYNDDGQLPDASGRTWQECDVNYEGGYRGSERLVFSNDGLVFYTADHYETFERVY